MPILEANFDEIKPLEAGTFMGDILGLMDAMTQKGQRKVFLSSTLMVNGEPKNKTYSIMLEGKGAFMWERLLRATGFSDVANRLSNGERVPFDSDQLIGQSVQFVIEQRPSYNDPNKIEDTVVNFLPA